MSNELRENKTIKSILLNMLIAAASLFVNGFGVYLTIQANIGASMSVPRSTSNFEEVSLILEDIAYQSSLDVMPAYMEVLIQGRSIRDVESLRCIQIIRNSYYCDMGFMLGNYGIGILGNCRAIVKDNTDIVSTLTKSASGFDRSLKNLAKQVN